MAAESASEGPLPSFAELQDAGAIIGEVRIINYSIAVNSCRCRK
jgi:hypothetical protein